MVSLQTHLFVVSVALCCVLVWPLYSPCLSAWSSERADETLAAATYASLAILNLSMLLLSLIFSLNHMLSLLNNVGRYFLRPLFYAVALLLLIASTRHAVVRGPEQTLQTILAASIPLFHNAREWSGRAWMMAGFLIS